MDRLLTMEEVAARLRTTPRHVRRLVFERRIAYRKLGRYVRFHPDDVAEYVAATRIAAGMVPGAGGAVARIRPTSAAARRRAG
jgi:excisionase family DNA binding protein